jgi:anti-sigma B factor antagonist
MDELGIKKYFSPGIANVVVVKLTGYVDHSNSRQVENVIADIMATGKNKIIFDFSELVYMSSAGWGAFVGEIKTVREKGGDIKIAAMTPEVSEVYQILEFFHIIDDYPTINDAMKSFGEEVKEEEVEESVKDEIENGDVPIKTILEQEGVKPHTPEKEQPQNVILVQEKAAKKTVPLKKDGQAPKIKKRPKYQSRTPAFSETSTINVARLPLNEKIKRVVADFPLVSIIQIRKLLVDEKYGATEIGLFKLYYTMKSLNLESKSKRYRFYRST